MQSNNAPMTIDERIKLIETAIGLGMLSQQATLIYPHQEIYNQLQELSANNPTHDFTLNFADHFQIRAMQLVVEINQKYSTQLKLNSNEAELINLLSTLLPHQLLDYIDEIASVGEALRLAKIHYERGDKFDVKQRLAFCEIQFKSAQLSLSKIYKDFLTVSGKINTLTPDGSLQNLLNLLDVKHNPALFNNPFQSIVMLNKVKQLILAIRQLEVRCSIIPDGNFKKLIVELRQVMHKLQADADKLQPSSPARWPNPPAPSASYTHTTFAKATFKSTAPKRKNEINDERKDSDLKRGKKQKR